MQRVYVEVVNGQDDLGATLNLEAALQMLPETLECVVLYDSRELVRSLGLIPAQA